MPLPGETLYIERPVNGPGIMNSTLSTMLATAAIIGATVWLTLTLGANGAERHIGPALDGYRISARFDNVGHLEPGDRVAAGGVTVGRVTDIAYDFQSYEAVVTMTIEARYDSFPVDSSASILTAGMVGDQYVGLQPGAEQRMLGDGDSIDITSSALILEQIIGQFLYNMAQQDNAPSSLAAPAVETPGF